MLMIKKVSNIVDVLIPLPQSLYNSKFTGSTYQDNITITKMYEDMDEKMYILTSVNRNNTQLSKLDAHFTKLFDLVMQGVRSYIPPKSSGGSMTKRGLYNHHYHTVSNVPQHMITDKLYLL
ncbi:MAG: hypothetical protein EOO99_12020 [Pedobacter sp.]|nr:MAG: hypothetical protein EOO99_12020 [Pedobacter sp.]